VTERTNEQRRRVGGINPRVAAWLAWSLCALCLALIALSLLVVFLGWSTPLPSGWSPWGDQVIEAVGNFGAPVLGGLIASRRPENPYGWLWLGFGMSFTLVAFVQAYALYALVLEPGSLPAPRTIVTLIAPEGFTAAITLASFILLLFPDGRLPSRRWRFLAWVVVAVGALLIIVAPLHNSGKGGSGFAPVGDPIGVGGIVGKVTLLLIVGGIMVLFAAIILSAVSLVFRFRRASGVERQQIKWFTYAAVLVGTYVVLNFFISGLLNTLFSTAVGLALCAAVGVAILKYRLYDIDVIINRTLVYGSLTLMLALIYLVGVATIQALFGAVTDQEQQPQIAVVVSTLVIAALFNPLRRRIQSFIDRRFYRRKYDARKTLDVFGARLRQETDIRTINDDLITVVWETMQPAHVSLWLRPDRGPKRSEGNNGLRG
jgi:hypothetical protein